MDAELKPICAQCAHADECQKPCHPVELILSMEAPAALKEKALPDGTIDIRNYRELYFWGIPEDRLDAIADTPENRLDPYPDFRPKNKQTVAFYQRYLMGKSTAEVAQLLGVSPVRARNLIQKARKRMRQLLEIMNQKDCAVSWIQKKPARKLSKKQKGFVLYHCMGLPYKQVQEIVPDVAVSQGRFYQEMTGLKNDFMGEYDRVAELNLT